MEIGSFIELQFMDTGEYYDQEKNIARLNTGRAAIWHACRVLQCTAIWLPYYQCDTVRKFLKKKEVEVKYYHIDERFNPIDLNPNNDEAVLLVNYYGVMSSDRMRLLAQQYNRVIIDNSQAFFCKPIENCMNVYSCRKFIGVPDGAYVIGDNAELYVDEYEQGYSSDTSLFMIQRIEYGCEGKAYTSRQINEQRIDTEDCLKMSRLTRQILRSTDYSYIREKRIRNFILAHQKMKDCNCINPLEYYAESCVPMVYPLVIEEDSLCVYLQQGKHFQGHWWSYLLDEIQDNTYEYWLSRFIVPITIDQRYGNKEIEYISNIVHSKQERE